MLPLRRERERVERDSERVAVAPMLDDRGAILDADEPGALISVHHCLVRLKGTRGAELHLQELCAGDRVQAKCVHARTVRQDSRSSFCALRCAAYTLHAGPATGDDESKGRHTADSPAQSRSGTSGRRDVAPRVGHRFLEDALGYLELRTEQKPAKLERAAVRWHGRLEIEATFVTLAGVAALARRAGEQDAIEALPGCYGESGRRFFREAE